MTNLNIESTTPKQGGGFLTNPSNELIAINQQTINDEITQTVNARDLHEFLAIGKMFANWINDRINQYSFIENKDYIVIANSGKNPSGGRPSKEYVITIDMAKELSMVERNKKGQQARRYFIECEKQLRQISKLPDFNNPALAARAWAEQYEQRHIAEQQRDHAIATKAEIGSRREATAMNTASIKSKENEKLKQQLDESMQYATIKRMEKIHHGLKFNWRALKSTSKEMGLPPIDVFDPNFDTVKAYHRDVWKETYALDF